MSIALLGEIGSDCKYNRSWTYRVVKKHVVAEELLGRFFWWRDGSRSHPRSILQTAKLLPLPVVSPLVMKLAEITCLNGGSVCMLQTECHLTSLDSRGSHYFPKYSQK